MDRDFQIGWIDEGKEHVLMVVEPALCDRCISCDTGHNTKRFRRRCLGILRRHICGRNMGDFVYVLPFQSCRLFALLERCKGEFF